MTYNIRMGIPEMAELWVRLKTSYRDGTIDKKDAELYKKSGARRMFWVYGPDKKDITIIGLEPHPEDAKNGAYDRVTLSDLN